MSHYRLIHRNITVQTCFRVNPRRLRSREIVVVDTDTPHCSSRATFSSCSSMSGVRSSMPSMNYIHPQHVHQIPLENVMRTAASSPLSFRGRPASKDLRVVFPVCSANLCTRRTVRSETSRMEAISGLSRPRAENETICFFTSSGICFRLPMMRSQSRRVYPPTQPVAPPDISHKRSVAQSGASSWAFP